MAETNLEDANDKRIQEKEDMLIDSVSEENNFIDSTEDDKLDNQDNITLIYDFKQQNESEAAGDENDVFPTISLSETEIAEMEREIFDSYKAMTNNSSGNDNEATNSSLIDPDTSKANYIQSK